MLDHRYLSLDDLVEDVAVMYSNAQAIEHAQVRLVCVFLLLSFI